MACSPNDARTRFYQHYEILTRPDGACWELGRGAMGVTYKARDVNLNTPVALKIINAPFSARPDARRRFLREAQAAAQLRHPNVASVFHFGTINALTDAAEAVWTAEENADAGDCFYAMDFIDGETLEARVRRAGPLPPMIVLEIGEQVARALAAAEGQGLVHRDVKPSNIMLEDGETSIASVVPERRGGDWVKVIDFGLAQSPQDERRSSKAGQFLGTPAFASPEQVKAGAVDHRSDIYSLGATLWYALTGRAPFPGKTKIDRGWAAVRGPLPVAQLIERGVPEPIIALLRSMLARDPGDRPGSAVALGQAVRSCRDQLGEIVAPRVALGARRGVKWARVAGGLALAASLIALAIFLARTPSFSPNEKSIAVLPFQNLSGDPADGFFAEGVQDDLISRLVKIRELKVISRLGTSHYRADAPRDLLAIGQVLGARHVVQGSLRRSGGRVFLQVSLADTRDGKQIWAERYDRELADTIELQGSLATTIARALDARLSPQESVGVRAPSTHNPDAYVLYLRGRKFETALTFAISDFEAAQLLYQQAIALDPGFALAHARLASTLALLYRYRGPSAELRNLAYTEAEEALRLRPELGEAHLANALCSYQMDRDFEHALPELEKARELLPNDTEAESIIAFIHRRRGEWREARAGLERCLERDPRNATYLEELFTTDYLLRDWPRAKSGALRAEALNPILPQLKIERARLDFWTDGNLAPLQKVFAELETFGDPEGITAWVRWDTAMIARDFGAAQAALDGFPFETLSSVYSAPIPKSYLEGCIALAQGDKARAREKFEAARPAYEAEALAHPESAVRHARLGLLYAYLGRKTEAIREGTRAVELKPVAQDAFEGPEEVCNLALIHARVGDADEAIAMIESQLRAPGCVFFYEASMSLWELRWRWQWDSLRTDPRFQKILAEAEPATVWSSPARSQAQ